MLFAPSAKHAAVALQDKLTSLQGQVGGHQRQQQQQHQHRHRTAKGIAIAVAQDENANKKRASGPNGGSVFSRAEMAVKSEESSKCHHHHRHTAAATLAKGLMHDNFKKVEMSALVRPKPEDIVAAMRKLDAKLVAYLAGVDDEDVLNAATAKQCLSANTLNGKAFKTTVSSALLAGENGDSDERGNGCLLLITDGKGVGAGSDGNDSHFNGIQQEQSRTIQPRISGDDFLKTFKSIVSVRIEMEALTLQPEGTKRMELLQSEIRPIFTVECQLSDDLIRNVPRSDNFLTMQFESEKFHSLTQCARFGQVAERQVNLSPDSSARQASVNSQRDAKYAEAQRRYEEEQQLLMTNRKIVEPNLGHIHFTVWWREPGTCLNEMLGTGYLQLSSLYNASLLEQCKCIWIERRGVHLASLYFKIKLKLKRNFISVASNNESDNKEQTKTTSTTFSSSARGDGAGGGVTSQTNSSASKSGEYCLSDFF